MARVKALLRRTQGIGFKSESLVSIGGELSINFGTREVFLSGKQIKLTPTEYHLFSELVRKSGAHRLPSAVKESNMNLGLKGDKCLEEKVTITITQKDMLLRYRSILVGK